MRMKIEDWAMYQTWEELDAEEQGEVLHYMCKEEYQNLHAYLLAVKELDAEVMPSARLRSHLLQQWDKTTALEKKGLQSRIPLWQAAATVLLAILATYYFKPNPMLRPQANVVYLRDTVVHEKIVWKEKVVQQQQIVYRYRDTLAQAATEQPKGVSLEDTPELLSLFTQAEK